MIKIKKEALLIEPSNIKPSSKDFEVLGTLNPAAVRLPNNKILLYIRVIEKLKKTEDKKYFYVPRMIGKTNFKLKIDKFPKKEVKENSDMDILFENGTKRLTFISHLRRAYLDPTGFQLLSLEQYPGFYGIVSDGELGVEDPRITKIGNRYIMTYVTLSREQNISTALAISKDCINWERKGIIFGEQDKDVVIFPEKINGKYYALDRPEGNFQFSLPHIEIAASKNLKSWGGLKSVRCVYKEDGDCPRNGAGPPPIKTKKGWLLLYHAVTIHKKINTRKIKKAIRKNNFLGLKKQRIIYKKEIEKIPSYGVGAALFDLKKPTKLIARSPSFLITPEKDYDIGTFEEKRIIFPTGLVLDEDEKHLLIYSGGGDRVTTVKKIATKDILKSLKRVKT